LNEIRKISGVKIVVGVERRVEGEEQRQREGNWEGEEKVWTEVM